MCMYGEREANFDRKSSITNDCTAMSSNLSISIDWIRISMCMFLLFSVVTCNDFGAVCNRTSEYQSIRLVTKKPYKDTIADFVFAVLIPVCLAKRAYLKVYCIFTWSQKTHGVIASSFVVNAFYTSLESMMGERVLLMPPLMWCSSRWNCSNQLLLHSTFWSLKMHDGRRNVNTLSYKYRATKSRQNVQNW